MKFKIFIFSFIAFLYAGTLFAKVTLPSVFSSGMVLQQNSLVNIWGKATKEVRITTSWDGKNYITAPDKTGNWKTKLQTPTAGGPFTIIINDGEELKLTDVLIGEVWLASGQSNMEMPLKGFKGQPVEGSEEAIKGSANPKIRFFNVQNISWKKPLDDCKGAWLNASPQNASDFSAIAYFYAKILQEKLNVPIGIIEADWGGTVVQAWMSESALASFPETKVPVQANEGNKDKNTATGLYNGMINPIKGYNIKGAIWYQGEQNRNEPDLYLKMFPAMVKQWRKDWGVGDFAFYYAQIAPYISKTEKLSQATLKLVPYVPVLRESQLLAEKKIKNAGMAVLMDIGASNTIHPPNKKSVAERLSYLALAKTYKFDDIPYTGATYKKSKVKGNAISLSFDNTAGGLVLKNKDSNNFEIAGADKVFYPAKVVVDGNQLTLSSDKVTKPVAARYAFKAWAMGDLYNNAGLPVSSFRTDKWSVVEK
ncbi:sialate O-acetylesterase [Pedobacter arcticus]|uniref:sialate O-acetylesterase n=1 Tax=Pedobacter arcticus TaxID=752140 RepID=UPI0002F51366|nr:sialate O-acetylesterase [Pedobacter arcticus]